MEELIEDVEQIINVYSLSIEREKRYYNYPFKSNLDHHYKLMN